MRIKLVERDAIMSVKPGTYHSRTLFVHIELQFFKINH